MKILLFAGTVEGRKLTEYILSLSPDIELTVSCATAYGTELLPGEREGYNILEGRLEKEGMEALIKELCPDLVIDATHPYALIVSQNIRTACEVTGARLIRVRREEIQEVKGTEPEYADSLQQALDALKDTEGNIFSALGAKSLEALTCLKDFEKRVYVRILPDPENLKKALDLGYPREHVICMQGPFSREVNRALFKEADIKILITKESGSSGGYAEKLLAAEDVSARSIVIRRPAEKVEGVSVSEACELIGSLTGDSTQGSWCDDPVNETGMKRGVTTGACAALGAKAAACMALTGKEKEVESLVTPSGISVGSRLLDIDLKKYEAAACSVKKFSGDDPDVTDGAMVRVSLKLLPEGDIIIDGGEGIGVVTKPGLSLPVGEKAINPVPRAMIKQAVSEVFEELGYAGGADVTVSIPGGEELAKKTFNSRLGIEGGLSVLGTTGVIEPMSHAAFIDAVAVQMDVKKALGQSLILAPGSIGASLATGLLGCDETDVVLCGNFIGETLELAVKKGFDHITLAGHMGKLVKLAAGVMNTHSHVADARMETIGVHAAMAGAGPDLVGSIMECISTDKAVEILEKEGILDTVMDSVMKKIVYHVRGVTGENVTLRIVVFCGGHSWSTS